VTEAVSIVGLGKLGLPLAACFATKLTTIGVDLDPRTVGCVNAGHSPFPEPGLDELIAAAHAGHRLRATSDPGDAIRLTDMTYVLVPTPSRPDGSFSNAILVGALKGLGEALRASDKRSHLFVISSTVMPGTTRRELIPAIESAAGRRAGEGFELCYDPDFVALGETISGFLKPALIVIGQDSAAAGNRVAAVHRAICQGQPEIAQMSIESAEIAKVALNAYITMKITFANHVANICERVPHADVDAITHAVGTDPRISRKYFTGGMAFGGNCFPRDTIAYCRMAANVGLTAPLMEATETINDAQNALLLDVVLACARGASATVGVAGVAFRPDTPVITASPAIHLIRGLRSAGVRVVAFDPLAEETARAEFGDSIEYASSLADCLARCDVVAVTHRSPAFKSGVESHVPQGPLTIVDCWRIVDPVRVAPQVRIVPLGRWTPSAAP
jgi:UDPglucose 6-dehydrogenase